MSLEQERIDLAGQLWVRINTDDTPLLSNRTLTRAVPVGAKGYNAKVLEYLNTYVDAGNAVPMSYVDAPRADQVEYPGRWRLVSNSYNAQINKYVQVLRLGWAESLNQDECMVRSGSDQRADIRAYDFYWANIAESAVDSVVSSLRTLGKFTDPVVQGETKSGVFVITNIVPQQVDGSYTITVSTIKVMEVSSLSVLSALTPLKKYTHDIENPFGLEGQYDDTDIGKKPTDGIVLTYRAISVDSLSAIKGLTDSDFLGLLSAGEQANYRFIKRDVQEVEGNTLTLSLAYQYIPLKLTTPEADARYVALERFNQSGKIKLTRSWPRIDPSVADSLITSNANPKVIANTVTDPMADGKTYTGEWLAKLTSAPETENEGIRIVQELILAGDQKLDIVIGKDPDHLVKEFFRWDYGLAAVQDFLNETGIEEHNPKLYLWDTPEVGVTKIVQTQKNADYSFDIHAIYSTTEDLEKTTLAPALISDPDGIGGTPLEVQDTFSKSSQIAYGWNIPLAYLRQYAAYYSPAEPVVNQRNKFTITRQTEHVFDFQGERETFVTIDSGWKVESDTALRKVSYRQGEYVLEAKLAEGEDFGVPASVPDRTIYQKSFKKNDVGSFDGRITKTEYYNITTVSQETSAARSIVDTAQTEGEEVTDFTADEGTIRRVDQSPTEANKFKINDRVITPHDQTAVGASVTALETVAVESHTEGEAPAVPALPVINRKVDIEGAPTDAGNTKSRVVTSDLLPWDSGSAIVVSDDQILQIKQRILKNQTSQTGASTNEEVKIQDNGRGGFDHVILSRSLSGSASGEKAQHVSSVLDWDIQKFNFRTPTWTTSTNSAAGTDITGWNIWMASMSRYRTITTSITKEYVSSEPSSLTVTSATSSGSEGAGTSYFKESRPVREGVWEVSTKAVTTSAWGSWGNKVVTFLYWVQTVTGTGS